MITLTAEDIKIEKSTNEKYRLVIDCDTYDMVVALEQIVRILFK